MGIAVPGMSVAVVLVPGVVTVPPGVELVPGCKPVASGTAAPVMDPGTTDVFVPLGCCRSKLPVAQPTLKAPATNDRAILDAIAADPSRITLPK